MGGKSKPAQRSKNNAKPSSSARASELLSMTGAVPTFVGFLGNAEMGLVPFAPGFALAEQMPDTFDASISTEYQLTMKKLSKKDPVTKKKALQELIELINKTELEELKGILPIWPKFYHNLATDPEHCVRELSQAVLQLLLTKCKKAVAPYIKQLVPVWLASQFDTYAPAASIATACFRQTFAQTANGQNRTREVCLHCQTEIIEYTMRNLTFYTAATLSTGKGLVPEDAEQKYQRVVKCSLKELSFFLEHTSEADDQTQIQEGLAKLIAHPKFWSYSKHKLNSIKAAWYEFVYNLLSNPRHSEIIAAHKQEVISASFKYIDESDPLVAPHIWGCILLIQTNYADWYELIEFQQKVWPKLCTLLRKAFNRNAQAICPNILPFFSQISHVTTQQEIYFGYVKQFFDCINNSITNQEDMANISKQDTIIIIKTFFECLRYFIQMLSQSKSDALYNSDTAADFTEKLLQDNVIQTIQFCLSNTSNNAITCKYFFQHTSALVAFVDKQRSESALYQNLLDKFWSQLFSITAEDLKIQNDINELYLERIITLINDLYIANPSLEEHRVKFAEQEQQESKQNIADGIIQQTTQTSKQAQATAAFIQKELKQLALQLLKICLKKTETLETSKYIKHIRFICDLFNDEDFFINVTENKSLEATLMAFVALLKGSFTLDDYSVDIVVDVTFEILKLLEKQKRYEFIQNELMKITKSHTKTYVLQRLLSHPLCIEPEVRTLLSQPVTHDIIVSIATDIVENNSKELFNLLHKCFFQTDTGEILISAKTVDSILTIISEPLITDHIQSNARLVDVDACGSFIAQIMPVVCSNENSSKDIQHLIFLRLFQFTMEQTVNDFISEDTLWEITTCWQDALSSEDIVIDDAIIEKCSSIVEQQSQKETLATSAIESMSEAIAKFVTCSTESIDGDDTKAAKIDSILKSLLRVNTQMLDDVLNVCLYIESLNSFISPSANIGDNLNLTTDLKTILQRSLLNFSTLIKLVCKPKTANNVPPSQSCEPNDEEITEDYCDPSENLLKIWSDYLQTQLIQYISVAAACDSYVNLVPDLNATVETLCLELSEKAQLLLRNSDELSVTLKERILGECCREQSHRYCRTLPYLVHIEQYSQFEESAHLLLAEDLQEHFAANASLTAYVNTLEYILPKLETKTISMQCPIMRCEPEEIWIKAAVFKCLIQNNFSDTYNDKSDLNIINSAVQFITSHSEKLHKDKELLSYQVEIYKQDMCNILNAVEFMNLLAEIIEKSPYQLTIKNWDVIRIGLGHWILSITKSLDYALEKHDLKTFYFCAHVFKLFASLTKFFGEEKQKSSTELLKNVYDEWLHVFSRDVNLTLFKTFYRICQYQDIPSSSRNCWEIFLNELAPAMEFIDYGIVYNFHKTSTKISLDHICTFLLKNLSGPLHSLKTLSLFIMRQITPHFVADDIELYEKKSDQIDKDEHKTMKWHFLNRFEDYIGRYDMPIRKYIKEFSFKLTEIPEMQTIDRNEALSFLMLWDCIIYICANSPVALRSEYTSWLDENKYEENLLHFLFRAMPVEILKNHSSKQMNTDVFKCLSFQQVKDSKLTLEKYACHLYTNVLSKLPAMVRKWWNTSPSRQKTFVDTLTSNFVSPLICQEELQAINSKKEKHENMQVTVHISTREVLAVYSIDEARMELVITLAPNYPLGSVKVDCNKQIGGRSSSRNVAMQLTIFLTHQNGTIFDGLTLWKNNLDKKFEGVEECYVCYTVIHQDTCQLPKLTCKTCKKKFHGPCLYKWFTTSSKSTCPICRNVF